MERRKSVLLRRGIVCLLKAKKLHGQLFCLVVRPVPGFVRLSRPGFERRCLKEHGAYHISIGFDVPKAGLPQTLFLSHTLSFPRSFHASRSEVEWSRLRKTYNGKKVFRLKVGYVGSGCSVALREDEPVSRDLRWAHGRDRYWRRDIHVSM